MAFNLGAVDPGEKLGAEIRQWLREKPNHPLIGLNVSGLIALEPDRASTPFWHCARTTWMRSPDSFVRSCRSPTCECSSFPT